MTDDDRVMMIAVLSFLLWLTDERPGVMIVMTLYVAGR